MHEGSSNPFPMRDQAQEAGPGVMVIQCNQNPLLAGALIALANQVGKKGEKHGRVH